MKLEIGNRTKCGKLTSTHKLNTTLLNNQWAQEEITREMRKYFEMNKNENITLKTLWDTQKAVPRGKGITVKYLKSIT